MFKGASFSHVFLSFRGETRDKFTCFLYEALKAEGFVAFMDKSDIHVGDEVYSAIKEGIKNSMSAIIVFSQNYAYSTWCLDELVLILERNKNSRYFIIPLLYEVEICDIRHQLGNYGLALEKHKVRHNDKVEKWREALVQAGNILGQHVRGPHSTFVQNTVNFFKQTLAAKFPECRLPVPERSVLQSSSSSSLSRHEQCYDKVILHKTSANNGLGAKAYYIPKYSKEFQAKVDGVSKCNEELKAKAKKDCEDKVILYAASANNVLGAKANKEFQARIDYVNQLNKELKAKSKMELQAKAYDIHNLRAEVEKKFKAKDNQNIRAEVEKKFKTKAHVNIENAERHGKSS